MLRSEYEYDFAGSAENNSPRPAINRRPSRKLPEGEGDLLVAIESYQRNCIPAVIALRNSVLAVSTSVESGVKKEVGPNATPSIHVAS